MSSPPPPSSRPGPTLQCSEGLRKQGYYEAGQEGGRKEKSQGGKEHLCSMMSHRLLSDPPTQNRGKQHGLRILLSWKVCVLSSSEQPAPAGKSTRPDRQVLLLTSPQGLDQTTPPPTRGGGRVTPPKKKKMPRGDKDRLTHTHTQASVSTNLEAIRNGSRVQCSAEELIHSCIGQWGGRGGERGP